MKFFPTFFTLALATTPIGVKFQAFYSNSLNIMRNTIDADDKKDLELSEMINQGFRYAYEALNPFANAVKSVKVTQYHKLDFDIVKYKPHYEVPKPWEKLYFSESVIVRNFYGTTAATYTTPIIVHQVTNETVFENVKGLKTTEGFKITGKVDLKKLPIDLSGEYSQTSEINVMETNRVLNRELIEIRTNANNVVVPAGKARVFLAYVEYKKHQIQIPIEAIVSGQVEGTVTLSDNVKVNFKTNMELIGSMLQAYGYDVKSAGKKYFFPALITLNRSIHKNMVNAEFRDFDNESNLEKFVSEIKNRGD